MSDLKIQSLASKEKGKSHKRKAKKYLKRLGQESLLKDVARVMDEKSIGSPAEYLATVMSGEDPRIDDTRLLDIVSEIRERGLDATPTLDEWLEIMDIIINNERYHKIMLPIEHSNKAAEILAKHLYTQKTEQKTKAQIEAHVKITPLKKKEIRKFKKIFNEEY